MELRTGGRAEKTLNGAFSIENIRFLCSVFLLDLTDKNIFLIRMEVLFFLLRSY